MAPFSDFSIETILGLGQRDEKRCNSCSPPRSSVSSSSSEAESDHEVVVDPVEAYLKSIALQHIHLARLRLLPPAWSQKQQQPREDGLKKSRKYSKEQTQILHAKYLARPYVTRAEMQQLSEATGLSMLQVKIWFQNRRLKDRKSRPL